MNAAEPDSLLGASVEFLVEDRQAGLQRLAEPLLLARDHAEDEVAVVQRRRGTPRP